MLHEFSPKERILNTLKGLETDRTPWSPFLAYYWDFLPKSVQSKGELAYLQEMGADPLLRGSHQLFGIKYHNCNITSSIQGKEKFVCYDTPVGKLTETYTYAPDANSWFLTGHPVTTKEDFKTLQYLYEHMEITEDYEKFNDDYKAIGQKGLLVPTIGVRLKTSFQSMVEHWCGTIGLTYALFDYEDVVMECLETMMEKDYKTVEISVQSMAEALLFYEDSSTTNISPAFFEEYAMPQINRWGELIHQSGKLLIHHACGHVRDLLPLMNESSIDMIESLSPPPTGNIDIEEAFSLLSPEKGIIGGIEPTFLLNCSMEELEARVQQLLALGKDRKYILANSDSCPPRVAYEKFKTVSRLVAASRR